MHRRTLLAGAAITAAGTWSARAAVERGGVPGFAAFRLQARARADHPRATLGHAFARGDVPAGSRVALLGAGGGPIPVQQDQENRWPDGSLRYAALSFVVPEALAAGQVVTYRLAAEAGEPDRAGVSPAQLAQATDFTLKVAGYGYGGDTFAVGANDVLATMPRWAGAKGWGTDPLGGWEPVRSGPICTEWRLWRFLKRDSDGASHRWVKAVLYVRAWGPGGPYEVLPSLRQSNAYGPHPKGTAGDAGPQGSYPGAAELWNGGTRLYAWGGPYDHRAVVATARAFDTARSSLTPEAGFAHAEWSLAVAVSGPGVPSALPQNKAFWLTHWGQESQGPGLATFRADTPSSPGDHGNPPWKPNAALNAGTKLTFPDGSVRYTAKGGTTGATPPTSDQPGAADGTVRWDVIVIQSFGRPGSGRASIVPLVATFPGVNTMLADALGDPVWVPSAQGAARPALTVAHDPAYLTRRARLLPPYDLALGIQPDPAERIPPYQPNAVSLYGDQTGDNWDDERVGYLNQSQAHLLLAPLDPVREAACKRMALNFSDYPGTWEDERTGKPVACASRPYAGLVPNPGFALGDWSGRNGDPAWQGLGNGVNLYQTRYRPLMDSSHLPSPWIMPFLRTGHAIYGELGLNEAMCMMASQSPDARNPSVRGRTYENAMTAPGNQQVRGMGWATRQLGMLDAMMPDADPMRAFVRDTMDHNAAFAAAWPATVDPRVVRLGALWEVGATNTIAPFFYHILVTCLSAEAWRGDRAGWMPLLAALSHATVGYWDEGQGGSGYYADAYHLTWNRDGGDPASAYPDVAAMMRANFPKAPPQPVGFYEDAGGGVPLTAAELVAKTFFQGEATFPYNCSNYVAITQAALATQAAVGVPRAAEAFAALRRRLVTPPLKGIAFVGRDRNTGRQLAYPAWAITAP